MSEAPVRLFVPGRPMPEGSVRAMPFLMDCAVCRPGKPCGNKRICSAGRRAMANVLHDNADELKVWRGAIAAAAGPSFARPWSGPVQVAMLTLFHRPQGHRGETGKLLASGRARPYPTVKPDADKLERAVLDALTGVAWVDDAQVIDVRARKVYTTGDTGLMIDVRPAPRCDAFMVDLMTAFGAEEGLDGDVWPVGRGGGQLELGGVAT